MSDYIKRADAIEAVSDSYDFIDAIKAIEELPSAEPIERISDNTIVVKYADYEDIGRIILTNGDIFCKMFYEDARQNDDSDYDSLVPDEYKTEPSDLISRADALVAVCKWCEHPYCEAKEKCGQWIAMTILPSADAIDVAHDIPEYCSWSQTYTNMVQSAVADAKSADAVQGEWVCKEREYNDCDGHYAHYWYECSLCGARPPKNEWKNEWHSPYCPSCGAYMGKKGGAE